MPALLTRSSTAWRSCWKPSCAAGTRANKTKSHFPRIGTWRTNSRSLRFTRFLTTAFPTRRPTENPTRLVSKPLGRARKTIRWLAQLLPCRWTTLKSAVFLRRWTRPLGLRADWWETLGLGSSRLNRQPVTAFESPPPQYFTATRRANPGSEAMNTLPATFLGLISSFRHA